MLTIMQNGFDYFKTDHQSLKYFESSGALIKSQSINIFASLSSHLEENAKLSYQIQRFKL